MKKWSVESLANWVGIPGVLLYVYSMLIYPWFDGHGGWKNVHAVWDKWQTFNAALLAFVASLIALNISRIKDEKQRDREFSASKAFLPAAFNELSVYFERSAAALADMWDAGAATPAFPTPPTGYREVFRDCIRHATPEIGGYLASILVKLQIHEARLHDLSAPGAQADKYTLMSYMYGLGSLKVSIDKQYEFARGENRLDNAPATWEDFKNAYGILNLHIEEYEIDEKWSLKAFTERALARQQKQGH